MLGPYNVVVITIERIRKFWHIVYNVYIFDLSFLETAVLLDKIS